ncbi:hypothetical protein U1Q18_005307 [Sarracenia purpurea var. burkii]
MHIAKVKGVWTTSHHGTTSTSLSTPPQPSNVVPSTSQVAQTSSASVPPPPPAQVLVPHVHDSSLPIDLALDQVVPPILVSSAPIPTFSHVRLVTPYPSQSVPPTSILAAFSSSTHPF